jgi:FlaA1/EpsC-like NDP-sugar epimerase
MGRGGEIFILDMGEPIKILDLAKDVIKLSGLKEGEDIEIEFVGLRPGEKLFEEILTEQEGTEATKHAQIFVAHPNGINKEKLDNDIRELEQLALQSDFLGIRAKLKEVVPEYRG